MTPTRAPIFVPLAALALCLPACSPSSQPTEAIDPETTVQAATAPPHVEPELPEEVVELADAAAQIAAALAAAPPDMRDGASVRGWTPAGELVLLRRGDVPLTCLADEPGDDRFQVACYHHSLEPYMRRGRELRAEGIDGPDNLERRHEEIDAGLLPMPEHPAAVTTLGGPLEIWDAESGEVTGGSWVHAVYTPYATVADTGIPTSPPTPGAPWLMRAGTPSAHLMVVPPREGETTDE